MARRLKFLEVKWVGPRIGSMITTALNIATIVIYGFDFDWKRVQVCWNNNEEQSGKKLSMAKTQQYREKEHISYEPKVKTSYTIAYKQEQLMKNCCCCCFLLVPFDFGSVWASEAGEKFGSHVIWLKSNFCSCVQYRFGHMQI